MLIKRISLRNFQAHASLDVDLSDFTVIIGPSSSGKTAILRALDWLFYGSWDRTYPTNASIATSIDVTLEDGTTISRVREGDSNIAYISQPGRDAVEFRDFGEIVPGIFDLINVRDLEVGTRTVNLNFSHQDDPVFMIHESWSKPVKAQWIGRLYGAHVINAMLRLMSKDKRDAEAARKHHDQTAKALEERIWAYNGLEEALEAAKAAEAGIARLEALEATRDGFKALVEVASAIRGALPLLKTDIPTLRRDIQRLSAMRGSVGLVAEVKAQEAKLASQYCILQCEIGPLKDMAARLTSLVSLQSSIFLSDSQAPSLVPDHDEYRAKLVRLSKLWPIRKELYGISNKIHVGERRSKEIDEKLTELRVKVKTNATASGKCKICGAKPKATPEAMTINLKTFIGQ